MVLLVLLVLMLTHGDDCVPLLVQSLILCNGLAAVAHCLCVDDLDSAELMAFVACNFGIKWQNKYLWHLLRKV